MNQVKTFSQTLTFRMAIIAILAIVLLIPVSMVKQVINDREFNRQQAIADIHSKWGASQTVAGPILTIPYYTYVVNSNGVRDKITEFAHFLPSYLKIDGFIDSEERSRGIYDTVVYTSDISFSGTFDAPDVNLLNIDEQRMQWDEAFVSVGIPDMRGIESNLTLQWNDKMYEFEPGIRTNDVMREGVSNEFLVGRKEIHFDMPIFESSNNQSASGVSASIPLNSLHKDITFSFNLNLNGSDSIKFIPVGRVTKVFIKSEWQSPKFDGAFLPDEREVSVDGFTGTWEILDLNRNYPQQWTGSTHNIYNSVFGVELLSAVDQYHKSTRSAKYALLIITLTFLVYISAEIFNRRRVHIIQYSLIGLAIILFYSLLVSTSEVLGFNLAYLISSMATIGLITMYSRSVLKNILLVKIQAGVLAFVYLFIYIILQLEDYALLVGSIGLFIILATIMYISRKIDWYSIGEINNGDSSD